jgi:hypothetical protein
MTFAAPKTRLEDQRYIEDFDVQEFGEYVSNKNNSADKDRERGRR